MSAAGEHRGLSSARTNLGFIAETGKAGKPTDHIVGNCRVRQTKISAVNLRGDATNVSTQCNHGSVAFLTFPRQGDDFDHCCARPSDRFFDWDELTVSCIPTLLCSFSVAHGFSFLPKKTTPLLGVVIWQIKLVQICWLSI